MNEMVDYEKAYVAYNRSMALGGTEALFPLGLMHAYNLTDSARSNNNLATALTYYYFSALDGHIEGQLALGFRHFNGIGAPKNCKTASHYYKLAAEKVIAEQQDDQIVMLNEFRLLTSPSDPELDAENELLAVDPISSTAYKILAFRYYYGVRGYIQDLKAAFENFEKASELGDPKAKASLGEMYLKGQGVEQSYAMAHEYFKEAAELEDPKG